MRHNYYRYSYNEKKDRPDDLQLAEEEEQWVGEGIATETKGNKAITAFSKWVQQPAHFLPGVLICWGMFELALIW